jgi:hypothetical protein
MCSQVHILTNHCACGGQRLRIVQLKDKPSYVLMCLTTEMELTSKMLRFFKKNRLWTESLQEKKIVSGNFCRALFSLLGFLAREDRTDRLSWNAGNELPPYAV